MRRIVCLCLLVWMCFVAPGCLPGSDDSKTHEMPPHMLEDMDDMDMDLEFVDLTMRPDADMAIPKDMGGGDTTMGVYPKEAQVVQGEDKTRVLLQGAVLTPEGVIDPGEVLIERGVLTCVDAQCDAQSAGAMIVKTHGIISPGLVDGHNHVSYNFLPEWVPPEQKKYMNRYQWSDEVSYEQHVLPLTQHRASNTHFCPAARWGELRSLLHGTTTMQSQSYARPCINGGVRNADHANNVQYDHMRTTISSPRDLSDLDAQSYVDSFFMANSAITRFAVHMAEGYEGDHIEKEFASFAGRDTRPNRHMGVSLLEGGHAILIHSLGLGEEELQEVKSTNSKIVWSPSSNMALYERTANINRILELEIPTGLGPDWTISGEDDMLGELRFAHSWALEEGVMRVTPKKLWEMATADGAYVLGLDTYIGALVVGQVADVVVFRRRDASKDVYEQLIESRAKDVRLVFIDGEAYSGDANLMSALARRQDCDTMDACGVQKFVCVRHEDDDIYDSVATIEGLLTDILEGTGYPEDEQYGRGDELLPLIVCARPE